MAEEGHIAVWAQIEGMVQGVAYRDWAQRTAEQLGLNGWVRNRRSGIVEVVLCGPEEAVRDMLELCWHGPPAARVSAVRTSELPAGQNLQGFEIQPTL